MLVFIFFQCEDTYRQPEIQRNPLCKTTPTFLPETEMSEAILNSSSICRPCNSFRMFESGSVHVFFVKLVSIQQLLKPQKSMHPVATGWK